MSSTRESDRGLVDNAVGDRGLRGRSRGRSATPGGRSGGLGRSLPSARVASLAKGETWGAASKQQGRNPCVPATAQPPSLPQAVLPPFANAGPSTHPPLPQNPPTGAFGHPPNVAPTTGCSHPPAEVALRRAWLGRAMTAAQSLRPISVRFLRHYVGASASVLAMQPGDFLAQPSSRLPDFLRTVARREFRQGIVRRLRNPQDPQGSLRGGQVRFLQYRDGVRPYSTGGAHGPQSVGADMATSLGAYYVHSALWAQARQTGQSTWTVQILRWYAQVYDWYNWNQGQDANIVVPARYTLPATPWPEVRVTNYRLFKVISIPDDWFRDLEVSGGARSYLVYTVPFEVPATLRQPFQISLP